MKPFVKYILFLLILLTFCSPAKKDIVVYQCFIKHTWYRFDKLIFKVPIEKENLEYDIFFFVNHSRKIQFENINFSMIMNTPSGEERINQYSLLLQRNPGEYSGKCEKDSCNAEIALKRSIKITEKGFLIIEIESLVPRMEIPELFGAGIRVIPKG